jgi:RsiW-degrading membrane proteinase PrsW (M82 family)
MKFSRIRIAALSRDPSFLLRTVLWILLPGLAIAFGIGLLRSDKTSKSEWEETQKQVEHDIAARPISSRSDCVRLLEEIRLGSELVRIFIKSPKPSKSGPGPGMIPSSERMVEAGPFLRPKEQSLMTTYFVMQGIIDRDDSPVMDSFAEGAAEEPASGLICSMYGDLLRHTGKYEDALKAYERGATDSETGSDCRRRALSLCTVREWKDSLRRLYKQPGWREAVLEQGTVDDSANHSIAVAAGDWTGVLQIVWHQVWSRLKSPLWIVMASLSGLLWFLVIHVGAAIPLRMWWRGLLGFGCGLLSIPLTHIFNTLQEFWFNAPDSANAADEIVYCVSGIGLREELAKLVLFAPLLILLRRATAAQVLAVAASVGLGFAALENINYFEGGRSSAVWARFLTANFLHFALTGLAGLALWQAVRNSAWLPHFVWVFVGAVVFHGLWDFRPADLRIAGDYGYFIVVGLVLLSLYFFRELSRYSQPVPGVPSALLIFLAGGALMLSLLVSITAWDVGFRLALVSTFQPVLQLFAIGAAMFYQLRNA